MESSERIRRIKDPRRKALMELPLSSLIAEANCKFNCPKGHEFKCGCEDCGQHEGFFKKRDHERLSKEQFVTIETCRTSNGWLSDTGCTLPRELRSEDCLRAICLEFDAFEV